VATGTLHREKKATMPSFGPTGQPGSSVGGVNRLRSTPAKLGGRQRRHWHRPQAAKPEHRLPQVEERRFRKAADPRRYPSREPMPPIPLSKHDTDSYPGRRGSDPRLDWRLQVLVGKPDAPSAPAFLKNRYCRASEEYLRAQTAFLGPYGTGMLLIRQYNCLFCNFVVD
jgi:hypothetical protein